MRKELVGATGVALCSVALAACATTYAAGKYGSPAPTPPTEVAVFLRKGPVPGGCAAVTQPQIAHVIQGKTANWEIVNVSCDPAVTVQFEFPVQVIEFEREQCPATSPQASDDKSPRFCFEARGKVIGKAGQRVKYKVKLSTGFVEDPEVDIYPPPGN
jgi:hypothetical protein